MMMDPLQRSALRRRSSRAIAALLLGCSALGLPSRAAAGSTDDALRALVAKDLRVATIAMRLQMASVDHCAEKTGLPGLVVQVASQYGAQYRSALGRLFGMTDAPTVVALVDGGAAQRSGVMPGDAILAVNDMPLGAPLKRKGGHSAGADGYTMLVRQLDAAFAKGPVELSIRRDGIVRRLVIAGSPGCASIVQLDLSRRRNASSDGRIVSVSQALADFVENDDELAFAIGHELAHNILQHHEADEKLAQARRADARDDDATWSRRSEAQADYYAVYMLAWAGYDVRKPTIFWQRLTRSQFLGGLLQSSSHPRNSDRIRGMTAAAAEVDAKRRAGLPLRPRL